MQINRSSIDLMFVFTKRQVIYVILNCLLSLMLMILLSEYSVILWLISFSSVLSLSFFESLYHQGLSRKRRVVIFIFTMCVISVAYIIVLKWSNRLFLSLISLYFIEQFMGIVGGIYFTYLWNKAE